MTNSDKFWLDKCEELPQKYSVFVDKDEVYVVDNNTNEDVYTFSEYGWDLVLSLLRYIGIDAEAV